jgi:hypothetical protein
MTKLLLLVAKFEGENGEKRKHIPDRQFNVLVFNQKQESSFKVGELDQFK